MYKAAFFVFGLSVAVISYGAEPVLDNERVTVWDTTMPLPPAQHDFVAVSLSHVGSAIFGHKGDVVGKAGLRTVVIEFKDHPLALIANTSGYPLAFPRANAKKLLENDRVVVWDNVWHAGKPTPMHFHDKDALVVYEATGTLQSTSADGKQVVGDYQFGQVRFSPRDHTHSELLVGGHGHAVVLELK
ncbi:MAG TPA: hypothetical protein VHW95_14095 [Steroidobacteraceae bacterium]|jgi:hypothetical protein|nr:hypothetical protein [Steroidobacteraceae bacterium]